MVKKYKEAMDGKSEDAALQISEDSGEDTDSNSDLDLDS